MSHCNVTDQDEADKAFHSGKLSFSSTATNDSGNGSNLDDFDTTSGDGGKIKSK